ncbi:shikimate kinase [Effusibacillus dendaii]|uniref:Shikimate kinase n=1 Tax=Effusibacillus dendaii TaxID=2743772 RepID=A0A7I8DAI3_9BACL|nr:shikimate kinase [Effusibacillus dendaii]BCJ85969.1 shikimate kinase [Effusibacillus dendaii]
MNIYLIGFMGTGKSTLGRVLSQRIGWPWIDTDQEIVKRQNRTIPEIFASEGEAYFRDRETELLKELALRKRILVTTGGGMVLRSENRELMRKSGIVISLTADRNVIRDRVARQGNRPLLAGDELEQRIDRLLKERAELYNEADIQIDTTSGDIDAAVRELLANPAFPLR